MGLTDDEVGAGYNRAHGVEVAADGVLPLCGTRADGWSLSFTNLPRSVDEMPECG